MSSDWIEALIEAVINDGDLWAFQPQIGGRNVNRIRRARAGSLDAALELIGDMVPETGWLMAAGDRRAMGAVGRGDTIAGEAIHPIPSVALTLATLRAYQSKQEGNQ